MQQFDGRAISWDVRDGAIEVALHREPCNEIGTQALEELEQLASALPALEESAHALIIYSKQEAGFSAGGDLRELYRRLQETERQAALAGIRKFHQPIHHVINVLHASPLPTIPPLH